MVAYYAGYHPPPDQARPRLCVTQGVCLAVTALEHMVPHAYTNTFPHKPVTYIQQTVNILTIEHVYRYATLLLGVRVCLWGRAYRHLG